MVQEEKWPPPRRSKQTLTPNQNEKKFNAVINGKGGGGKSFFAVNFIQYLKEKEINHVAVDCDNENSTLKRFHPEVTFLDLEDAT